MDTSGESGESSSLYNITEMDRAEHNISAVEGQQEDELDPIVDTGTLYNSALFQNFPSCVSWKYSFLF